MPTAKDVATGTAPASASESTVRFKMLLYPWLRRSVQLTTEWGRVPGTTATTPHYGVIIQVSTSIKYEITTGADLHESWQSREFVDLLQLLAVVDRDELVTIVAEYATNLVRSPTNEDEVLGVIRRGVPVHFRLCLTYTSINPRNLKAHLADEVFDRLHREVSMHERYHEVKRKMAVMLPDSDGDKSMLQWPVHVTLVVGIDSPRRPITAMEDENFFFHLTRFASAMRTIRDHQSDQPMQWAVDQSHAPLVFNGIELKLPSVNITYRVVQEAKALMATGIPVDVTLGVGWST